MSSFLVRYPKAFLFQNGLIKEDRTFGTDRQSDSIRGACIDTYNFFVSFKVNVGVENTVLRLVNQYAEQTGSQHAESGHEQIVCQRAGSLDPLQIQGGCLGFGGTDDDRHV